MTAWISVPDISLDDFLAWLGTARELYPDPRWVSPSDVADSAPCVFVHHDRVVLFLGDETGDRERALVSAAFPTSLALQIDDVNQWSELVAYANGTLTCSIYGAAEDDWVRVTGTPPDADGIAALLARDADCDEVPVEVGRVLLDLDLDEVRPQRVVRLAPRPFTRALDASTAPEIRIAAGGDVDPDRGPLAVETDADWPGLEALARSSTAIVARTGDELAYVIDTTAWPPRFTALAADKVQAAAFTPWGTLIFSIEDEDTTRTLLGEVASPTDPKPRWHRLPFEEAALARDVGVGVLVFPAPWTEGDLRPHLLTRDRHLRPLDLPPVAEDGPRGDSAAVALGEDTFLVQWLGATYRWRAGSIAPLETLAIAERCDRTCRAHDGSVFAVDAGAGLVRLDPNGAVTPLDPAARHFDRPKAIVPGPGHTLIVTDMADEAACKLLVPATSAVAVVSWATLALDWDPEVLYYDATRERLVVIAEHVHAAPWAELAAPATR